MIQELEKAQSNVDSLKGKWGRAAVAWDELLATKKPCRPGLTTKAWEQWNHQISEKAKGAQPLSNKVSSEGKY